MAPRQAARRDEISVDADPLLGYKNLRPEPQDYAGLANKFYFTGFVFLAFAFAMTNMSIFSTYWVSGAQHVFDSSHGTKRELAEHYGLRMFYGELSAAHHRGASLSAESVTLKIGVATKEFYDKHFDKTDIDYTYIAKAAAVGEFVFVVSIEALIMLLVPFFIAVFPITAFSQMPLERLFSFAATVVLAIAWITYIIVDPRSKVVNDEGFYCASFGHSLWLLVAGDFATFFAFLCFQRVDTLKHMYGPKSVAYPDDDEPSLEFNRDLLEAQIATLEAAFSSGESSVAAEAPVAPVTEQTNLVINVDSEDWDEPAYDDSVAYSV